jgi:uncharacterized coiled-coil protein SlyX
MAVKSDQRVAVAYLVQHPEERPEESKKLLERIVVYDRQVTELNRAINDAASAIEKMQEQFNKCLGGMSAMVDLVAESIPDYQAKVWADKYLKEKEEQSDAKG